MTWPCAGDVYDQDNQTYDTNIKVLPYPYENKNKTLKSKNGDIIFDGFLIFCLL